MYGEKGHGSKNSSVLQEIKIPPSILQNCKIEGGDILKMWIEIIPVIEYNKK